MAEYRDMELSTQVLIKEAINRGVAVEVLDPGDNFIRLSRDGRTEYVKQATRTAADSYIAPLIMENKEVTKTLLRERGLNVPAGVTVSGVAEALSDYPRFRGKAIVVKPKSTNFGKGVLVLKEEHRPGDFQKAVADALRYDQSVLIEEFIPGKEYRFLVIGGEVAAVLHRVPANVTGDGIRNIAELVTEKNKDPLRGKGYVTPLEQIRLGPVEEAYLSSQGKDPETVPDDGEVVYLRENSNISTGGDSIDFTDETGAGYKRIAIEAARAVGAKICGADIIIRDLREEPDARNYSIIELNFNPALHIHDFPYRGQNRRVEGKVLDLLGFAEREQGA
jgi:glutamate--cysteine ligase